MSIAAATPLVACSAGYGGRVRPRERSEVVLIGPVGVGKSTQGRLLAERLGVPEVGMDDLRWAYYAEIGYDPDLVERTRSEEGFGGVYRYWKPFEVHALERLLADHHDCVFHLGAGHSVYEDSELLERARRALAAFRYVVLLLPSPDPEESVRLLHLRRPDARMADGFDFHRHFVMHPSNVELATAVVYTADRSELETCEEILQIVRGARR